MSSEIINTSPRRISLKLPTGTLILGSNKTAPLDSDDVKRASILAEVIPGVEVLDVTYPASEREAVLTAKTSLAGADSELYNAKAAFALAETRIASATITRANAAARLKKAKGTFTRAENRRSLELKEALMVVADRAVYEKTEELKQAKLMYNSI